MDVAPATSTGTGPNQMSATDPTRPGHPDEPSESGEPSEAGALGVPAVPGEPGASSEAGALGVPAVPGGPARFYAAHRREAVRWATALTGRRDVGEDLAQEALLRTADRLGGLANPGGYLRRTVVNLCRTWQRSAGRERDRIERAHAGRPDTLSPTGHELLDVLARLPYRQRAAVVLRYWADWPDAEIADALGCRPTTVRVLLHRGLAALRTHLTEDPS